MPLMELIRGFQSPWNDRQVSAFAKFLAMLSIVWHESKLSKFVRATLRIVYFGPKWSSVYELESPTGYNGLKCTVSQS